MGLFLGSFNSLGKDGPILMQGTNLNSLSYVQKVSGIHLINTMYWGLESCLWRGCSMMGGTM